MIINPIVFGSGGGQGANKETYSISEQQTWSTFFGSCVFQLRYKSSEITIFVTGSTAPTAGTTTTIVKITQLNNGAVKSKLYRNSLGSSTNLYTPNQVNLTSTNFQSEASTAMLVDSYYSISNTGVFGAGSLSINSLIPANATVVISEAPLSDDLWGT